MTEGHTLTKRDLDCLRALLSLAGEGGWSRSSRARRLEASGLTWSQWRGAIAKLLKAEAIQRAPGANAEGEADAYRLSPEARDLCRSAQVSTATSTGISTPLSSSSSLAASETKSRKEEEREGVPTAQGGVLVVRHESPALDRLAVVAEAWLAEMVAARKATPAPKKCGCGRVKEHAHSPKTGDFMRCPAWQHCSYAKSKKPAPVEGPRISSARSEQERQARLEAATKAAAEARKVS